MSFLARIWRRIMLSLGLADILCDRCLYDHPSACRNPERPNSKDCNDFRPR
jgi:hypothetical protein